MYIYVCVPIIFYWCLSASFSLTTNLCQSHCHTSHCWAQLTQIGEDTTWSYNHVINFIILQSLFTQSAVCHMPTRVSLIIFSCIPESLLPYAKRSPLMVLESWEKQPFTMAEHVCSLKRVVLHTLNAIKHASAHARSCRVPLYSADWPFTFKVI